MDILDIIRQTVKGGMNRLGNEFSAVTPAASDSFLTLDSYYY